MPNKDWKRLEKELTRLGFVLVRTKKHNVWKHPETGKTLALPQSPGDWRSFRNQVSQLKARGIPLQGF